MRVFTRFSFASFVISFRITRTCISKLSFSSGLLLPSGIARGGICHQAFELVEILYAYGVDHPLATPVAGFGLLEIPAGDRIIDPGSPVHRRGPCAQRLPQCRAQALAARLRRHHDLVEARR